MKQNFLVEIGCEELPPKALNSLVAAFADGIKLGLREANLSHGEIMTFSAPRRLAVKISALAIIQPLQIIEKKGPATTSAYDKDGNPSPALLGFMKSANIDIKDLIELDGPKGKVLGIRSNQPGRKTTELLPGIIETALKKLPIPKPMRWGAHTAEFIRPVHWLLMLLGSEVVPATILEQVSDNKTYGHRFHYPHAITVQSPDDYERALATTGFVIADFTQRRCEIKKQIRNVAESLTAEALIDENLLEEISNIVEWPVAMACRFDQSFLNVPQESLISSMQGHQKCIPLLRQGKLINHFITISNIQSKHPESIISGNEKVMRARLSDAAFFYETDCNNPLSYFNERLSKVTFQAKLGSLQDKVGRVTKLAMHIAGLIGADIELTEKAATLSKADLMTNMVGEFPELQGIMGKYYARKDQEHHDVAAALDEQYWPKFAGDTLPETRIGQALSLADKLDTLVGIFAIGQKPTGSKDPFALRRAAIGVLRILIEKKHNLNLEALITESNKTYSNLIASNSTDELLSFMFERLRVMYQEQGTTSDIFEAVYAVQFHNPLDLNQRLEAIKEFLKLEEAANLIAANKRINNILKKNNAKHQGTKVDVALLQMPTEINLYNNLERTKTLLKQFEEKDYTSKLKTLSSLKTPIDQFFDNVMVICEDEKLRNNRLNLLNDVITEFEIVADISKLQE